MYRSVMITFYLFTYGTGFRTNMSEKDTNVGHEN